MKNFITILFLAFAGVLFAQPVRTTITDDGTNVTVQTPVNVKVIPICDFHWLFSDGNLQLWIEGRNELIPGGRLGNFTVNGATTQASKLAALGAISDQCGSGGSSGGVDTLYLANGTMLVNGDTLPAFLTVEVDGSTTNELDNLDVAYNNFGASASKITVDAAQGQTGGLEIEGIAANNTIIDLQGTGDFIIQDAGTATTTFADDGTITLDNATPVSGASKNIVHSFTSRLSRSGATQDGLGFYFNYVPTGTAYAGSEVVNNNSIARFALSGNPFFELYAFNSTDQDWRISRPIRLVNMGGISNTNYISVRNVYSFGNSTSTRYFYYSGNDVKFTPTSTGDLFFFGTSNIEGNNRTGTGRVGSLYADMTPGSNGGVYNTATKMRGVAISGTWAATTGVPTTNNAYGLEIDYSVNKQTGVTIPTGGIRVNQTFSNDGKVNHWAFLLQNTAGKGIWSTGDTLRNFLAGKLIIGTYADTTSTYDLRVGGNTSLDKAAVTKLNGNTAAPTIAANASAGTSASASVGATSSDVAGSLRITTGSGSVTAGSWATVTFSSAYTNAPIVLLTPNSTTSTTAGDNAAALMPFVSVIQTTTGFSIRVGGDPSAAINAICDWNYHVIGKE